MPVAANADSFYDNGSATNAVEDGSTMVRVLQDIHDGWANKPKPRENVRMSMTDGRRLRLQPVQSRKRHPSHRPVLDAHRERRQTNTAGRRSRIPPAVLPAHKCAAIAAHRRVAAAHAAQHSPTYCSCAPSEFNEASPSLGDRIFPAKVSSLERDVIDACAHLLLDGGNEEFERRQAGKTPRENIKEALQELARDTKIWTVSEHG